MFHLPRVCSAVRFHFLRRGLIALSAFAALLLGSARAGTDKPVAAPADEQTAPADAEPAEESAGSQEQGQTVAEADVQQPFVLDPEVEAILLPLFAAINQADVSRATVELSAESVVGGAVVDSQKSTYQIASKHPNKFTVYLKGSEQRMRIYSDGETATVAVAPDAYVSLPEPINTQHAVTQLPVPMGPYPEPVLALTLAGADPAVSLLGGMESVELIDRGKFRGTVPAIHLRGTQADQVTWDFWITQDKQPKPLRLQVDLTAMLKASDQVEVPEGFSYQLRFDFLSWRVTGEIDEDLFHYSKPEDATEYASLEEYYESVAGVIEDHPLLSKPAPQIEATKLNDEKITSKDLQDKVVVLDFWATWCSPCLEAIPVMETISEKYADKDVQIFAVNVGESREKVEDFVSEKKWDLDVLIDPDGTLADAFQADAIPLTIVIGKNGIVESAHVGFAGAEALRQRLTDELDVLIQGGRIASVTSEGDSEQDSESTAQPADTASSDSGTDANESTAKPVN